jgi:hypothetical protein
MWKLDLVEYETEECLEGFSSPVIPRIGEYIETYHRRYKVMNVTYTFVDNQIDSITLHVKLL